MDVKSFKLNSGKDLPPVGLGTYKIRREEDVLLAVDVALSTGYRLFDTASRYGNEIHLKKALDLCLLKHNLSREDIFITSKLCPQDMRKIELVKLAYEKSLNNLGVDYLDMYLIEFPGQPYLNQTHPEHKMLRKTAWSAMTKLYDEGLVDAIGVSNFTIRHLQELIHENHSVIPAVNQVEWHPYYHEDGLFGYCREQNIQVQGYAPFGGLNANGVLLGDPVVQRIAENMGVTPSQVLVAWSLQSDVPTIPKSKTPTHISENNAINFKLNETQMNLINNLNRDTKFAWDPRPFV